MIAKLERTQRYTLQHKDQAQNPGKGEFFGLLNVIFCPQIFALDCVVGKTQKLFSSYGDSCRMQYIIEYKHSSQINTL